MITHNGRLFLFCFPTAEHEMWRLALFLTDERSSPIREGRGRYLERWDCSNVSQKCHPPCSERSAGKQERRERSSSPSLVVNLHPRSRRCIKADVFVYGGGSISRADRRVTLTDKCCRLWQGFDSNERLHLERPRKRPVNRRNTSNCDGSKRPRWVIRWRSDGKLLNASFQTRRR